jgi:uncharacterized pyridoxal phosphate-containing UPF0001 family protein
VTIELKGNWNYPTAIRFGATHVRVGSSLFGERKPSETP